MSIIVSLPNGYREASVGIALHKVCPGCQIIFLSEGVILEGVPEGLNCDIKDALEVDARVQVGIMRMQY
ncbi:MAG: hypothetical protein A2288_02440 [Candidatus Moranbacteria bacterium RIFOXYA12_FULL_44_15]|nr:MAG: hypothetical protein A2288_02440 [Candidatus Moranbacteria bacterium RIFOXYA12_FULL_44_15]OGI34317.1 MAG: hypothetical protein A2259_03315 [Candidatus Moranbacteria bacterium RIFOXYA2_FULL_43_15]